MTFYNLQTEEERKKYIELLKITGSLSNLFSDSETPYIYYRAMENIFCKAFSAENLSRSDISADASKSGVGIGLKTFLQNNGRTFQKVAEFNRESLNINNLNDEELIYYVSEMRNDRIETTKRISHCNSMIYHLLTRSISSMAVFEEEMDLVDINSISNIQSRGNSVSFSDKFNEYNFNKSKSTLFKRFITDDKKQIEVFNVDILEDPYELLLGLNKKNNLKYLKKENEDIVDFIILPLYSPRLNEVAKKSGLNQWNASGRPRHPDEVYVPIPTWIHKAKNGFFKYNTDDFKTDSFNVYLPSGEVLSMRVAQQGGKALMSNPNKKIGEWLLREVLNVKYGTLLTKKMLDQIGIDSIKLSKRSDGNFYLDFVKSGSYEDFEKKYNDEKDLKE